MEPSAALMKCLQKFRQDANTHPRIKVLLKGWSPWIQFETLDGGAMVHANIQDQVLGELKTGESDADGTIVVRATEQNLIEIFSGRKNPARAFLDAELEIFGSDKDRVKLDAISLVLWGV
jgi:hypothetical protein